MVTLEELLLPFNWIRKPVLVGCRPINAKIWNGTLTAEVKPDDAARSVLVPVLLKLTFANVALPEESVFCERVPFMFPEPLFKDSDIGTPLTGTALLLGSSI